MEVLMTAVHKISERKQPTSHKLPNHSLGQSRKEKQFDCFDFCRWSLGANYNFNIYIEPESADYIPTLDELIDHEEL